jgi:LPS sulfotransferase NodH
MLGAVEGQSDYVRFIIICAGRSGSSLLRSLLNSHRRIVAFGEIFGKGDKIGWDLPGYSQNRKILTLFRDNPAEFLKKGVFGKYPTGITAVGFKYIYAHTNLSSWNSLEPFIKNQQSFKIIHLKRRNYLKSYLSLLTAVQTNQWFSHTGVHASIAPITIAYDQCLTYFKKTRAREEYFDTFFANHPKIEVIYENLVSEQGSELKRIQSFLGTDYEHLFPSVYKQSHQPLSNAIANYAGLKRNFKGTPWQVFFED